MVESFSASEEGDGPSAESALMRRKSQFVYRKSIAAHRDSGDSGGDRASSCKQILLLVIMVGLFVYGILHHEDVKAGLDKFVDWCSDLGVVRAAILVALVTGLMNLCMMPCFPLFIGAGGLFSAMLGPAMGALVGTLSVFFGIWWGSVAAFMLGKSVFKDFAEHAAKESALLITLSGMIALQGRSIVFIARMCPVLPAEVFNYACSAIPTLTVFDYAIGCLGSIVPVGVWVGTSAQAAGAVQASVGHEHKQPEKSNTGTIMVAVNVVIMAAICFVFWRSWVRYKIEMTKALYTLLSKVEDGKITITVPAGQRVATKGKNLAVVSATVGHEDELEDVTDDIVNQFARSGSFTLEEQESMRCCRGESNRALRVTFTVDATKDWRSFMAMDRGDDTLGIAFRKSMDMDDVVDPKEYGYLRWSSVVVGEIVPENSHWVRVQAVRTIEDDDDNLTFHEFFFLPRRLTADGETVDLLEEVDTADAGDAARQTSRFKAHFCNKWGAALAAKVQMDGAGQVEEVFSARNTLKAIVGADGSTKKMLPEMRQAAEAEQDVDEDDLL
jgi:uncharacterized membrane protein YdjX (TVP38/TMEM64 family)